MKQLDAFSQSLSQARFHLDIGDFEKSEDLLNQASGLLSEINKSEAYFEFYLLKINLLRSTRKRKECIQLWDELKPHCINSMQRCICFSGKGLDYLMLKRDTEAYNMALDALKEAESLPENNKILALQIKGEVYRRKSEWNNAITMYAAVAAISEKFNNQAFVAHYHAKIAKMLKELGYVNLAVDRLFEAEEHARKLGNIEIMQRISIWRADLYREMGEDKKALDVLQYIAKLYDGHI